MKIYELQWYVQDEKEWIAANTVIEALKTYFSITDTDIIDLDDDDDIIEVPKEKWSKMIVNNIDYDPKDKDDWDEKTFEQWMKENDHPDIIAGTIYE